MGELEHSVVPFLTDSTLDYLQDRNYDAACACHPEDVQLQYLYALSVANEYPENQTRLWNLLRPVIRGTACICRHTPDDAISKATVRLLYS